MYQIINRRLKRAGQRLKAEYREAKQINDLMLSYKLELRQKAAQDKELERSLKTLNRLGRDRDTDSLTVPAYILVGFLGSGKTTLLGQLIEWCVTSGLTPGLIINEFGRVSIDGQALRQTGLSMTELSNGCICCTAGGDLVPALIQMALNPRIDLILVEATGLANPAEMLDTLTEPALWKTVEVGGIISVVDSLRWSELIDTVVLARQQIEFADVIVMSKCDLNSADQQASLKIHLSQVAPKARVFESSQGKVATGIESLLTYSLEAGRHKHQLRQERLGKASLRPVLSLKPVAPLPVLGEPTGHAVTHSSISIHSLSFETEQPLNLLAFERFLMALPATVYRAKGFVLGTDSPVPYIFQQLPGFVKITPFSNYPPVSLRAVFIGQNLDEAALAAGLSVCT